MLSRLIGIVVLVVFQVGSAAGAYALSNELSCLIHPYQTITITAAVGGLLEAVTVDRGDVVKEGQILAVLDSSVERATGAIAHAQAELSNRRLADLELNRTTAEVALRTIKSPINGVVVERFMHPGEFPKQERILKLAQIDPLRVELYAPVTLIGKVSVGTQALIRPEEPIGGTYTAKVTVVDKVEKGSPLPVFLPHKQQGDVRREQHQGCGSLERFRRKLCA